MADGIEKVSAPSFPPSRRSPLASAPCRDGMTLLEVILALSLTVMLMIAIVTAVDLHLRVVAGRQASIEQAQLARSVLRLMADDLRSAVSKTENKSAGDDFLAAAAELGLGEMGSPDESPPDDDASLPDEAEPAPDDAGGRTADIADSAVPPAVPGLYGNQYQLEVDVRRLPRIAPYRAALASDGEPADPPGDVKTVAYYLSEHAPETSAAGSSSAGDFALDPADDDAERGGLVRRSVDRAVAVWAAGGGNLLDTDTRAEMVAPEVTALEFRYFDGAEWQTEWDSEELGGLPAAVEITIAVAPPGQRDAPATESLTGLETDRTAEGDAVYRLVVRLGEVRSTSSLSAEASPDAEPTEEALP